LLQKRVNLVICTTLCSETDLLLIVMIVDVLKDVVTVGKIFHDQLNDNSIEQKQY
jgi:hypothetical protein